MPIITQVVKNNEVDQSGIDTLARPSIPTFFVAENTATLSSSSISTSTSSSTATATQLIQTSTTTTSQKTAEATKLPNSAIDANGISYLLYFLSAIFIIGLGLLSFQNGIKNRIKNPIEK